jgi:hypothetical protein
MSGIRLKITILLSVFVVHVFAQSAHNAHFLFDEYQQSRVYQSNGRYSNELVNFSFEDNKLYFVDQKDGMQKVVSESLNIVSFWVDDRVFIPSAKGLKEILHDNGFRLYLYYNIRRQSSKNELLYGGNNAVAAVSTYSDFRGSGLYNFRNMGSEISNIYPSYSVIIANANERFFVDRKSFVRIFSSKKRKAVDEYLSRETVNFEQPEMVLELCKQMFNND